MRNTTTNRPIPVQIGTNMYQFRIAMILVTLFTCGIGSFLTIPLWAIVEIVHASRK